MVQRAGRVTCPKCGANNFDTVTTCYRCQSSLITGAQQPAPMQGGTAMSADRAGKAVPMNAPLPPAMNPMMSAPLTAADDVCAATGVYAGLWRWRRGRPGDGAAGGGAACPDDSLYRSARRVGVYDDGGPQTAGHRAVLRQLEYDRARLSSAAVVCLHAVAGVVSPDDSGHGEIRTAKAAARHGHSRCAIKIRVFRCSGVRVFRTMRE